METRCPATTLATADVRRPTPVPVGVLGRELGARPRVVADLRPLPDVAMTGTCTRECSEFGHSDTCWMPGQSSPSRRTKSSALKLSTFVPYQDRGGQEPAGAGSPSPPEDRNTKTAPVRLLPSYSAFSHSSHDSCKDSATLEEIPLTQTSDFPPTATPASAQTAAKREIYL
ncbi:protocadherin 18-like [Psammomys obesus]|uniref:protocadherin 18-like n=1 Tax=Psammomys obesus TaxID=48139 RepID=UPI0024531F44|nr:protocadherin 18-like [Psammomys obesus]